MASAKVLTAKELKERLAPFPVTIYTAAEGAEQVLVRRPSLRRLVFTGMVPVPLLADMSNLVRSWVGEDLAKMADKEEGARYEDALRYLNLLVCDVMVKPRAVMTAAEAAEDPEALLITDPDIPVELKEQILRAAMLQDPKAAVAREETALASEFPADRPGAGAPPDVPDVPPAAE